MTAIKVGDRVKITVPPWIFVVGERVFRGRVTQIDSNGRIALFGSAAWFHPNYTEIRVIPSHRADVQIDPLEGLPHDWRRTHADHGATAVAHPLVRDVIVEYARNMRFDPDNGLPSYGLHKVAHYAAQVARALALGIDPDALSPGSAAPVSARAHVNGVRS